MLTCVKKLTFVISWFDGQVLLNRVEQIGEVIEDIAAYLPEGEEMTIAEDGIGLDVFQSFHCSVNDRK